MDIKEQPSERSTGSRNPRISTRKPSPSREPETTALVATHHVAVPVRSWSEPRRTNRLEPAKARGDDGRVKLRGVQDTSDRARYLKNVDPYGNKNWEARENYKRMRSSQHAATASKAWKALHKWQASEKSLDVWYSKAVRNPPKQMCPTSPSNYWTN